MDKCLFTLMKYNRDKVIERLIKETKGKNTYVKNLIHQRHLNSIDLITDGISEKEGDALKSWNVPSATCKGKSYEVKLIGDRCNQPSCYLKCTECGACSHIYSCSCFDFLPKNVPCKHIHLIRRMEGFHDVNEGTSFDNPD